MDRLVLNPNHPAGSPAGPPAGPAPARGMHARLPGYEPTPVRELPARAVAGAGRVLVKDESARMGLPAFKILGASWAAYRALRERLGTDPEPWETVADLRAWCAHRGITLVTATAGNHGRAVARVARMLVLGARIYVPDEIAAPRAAAILAEGATLCRVEGSYDDAVRQATLDARRDRSALLLSDTLSPGAESPDTLSPGAESPGNVSPGAESPGAESPGAESPGSGPAAWVSEGYRTIFAELDEQLPDRPDLLLVPAGVGGLAAAAAVHYRGAATRVVTVEPCGGHCVQASLAAGERVVLATAGASLAPVLDCATPSAAAWPHLRDGLRGAVRVPDTAITAAMRNLAAYGVLAGPGGAASLAGAAEVFASGGLDLPAAPTVVLVNTEGVTDPDLHRSVVG